MIGCAQVEAGLDDLRAAYAELHEQLDSAARPPEEKERLAQHVRTPFTIFSAFTPRQL